MSSLPPSLPEASDPTDRLRRFLVLFAVHLGLHLSWATSAMLERRGGPSLSAWIQVMADRHLHSVFGFGACLPFLLWACRRFELRKGRLVRSLAAHALLLAPLVLLLKAVEYVVTYLLHPGHFADFWVAFLRQYQAPATYYAAMLLNVGFIYACFATVIYAWDFHRMARQRELHGARLEGLLAQAELDSLKMQLHPHFLFNALNALATLIKHRPSEAQRMVGLLGELLRDSHLHEVPLAQELELLKVYLDLEQIRFAGHLEVQFELEDEVRKARVPHLILQPLVENAIRHGIGPSATPGWIRIQARHDAGQLHLQVEDNGVGPAGWTSGGTGIGLPNTRRRLLQLYGPGATLEHGPRPEGGYRVSLHLPFHLVPERSAP